MEKFGSGRQLYAIVVGKSDGEFVGYAMGLLGDYDIEFVLCEDIYAAVGRLAKSTGGNVLVIGRFGQLNREKGRFFQKVSKRGLTCCCLAEAGSGREQKQVLSATKTGAFVINEPVQLEEVVTKLLTDSSVSSSGKKRSGKVSAFDKNEFLTTRAEMDALLGD